MIDFQKVETVCSCGRKTILIWNEAIPGEDGQMGAYIPQDLAFTYMDNAGWYCGTPGHSMKSLAGMTRGEYHKALMEASERGKDFNG
jgi:hypothetical protein